MAVEPVDILVFGAHADDIELSCGGTVAVAVENGQRVGLVDLTRGEMGTRGTPETRVTESTNARKILGASFRETLDLGDGGLRTGREQEFQIVDIIRQARPSIVIAPYPDDRHPDHARAGTLITDAAFYAGLARLNPGGDATGGNLPAHRPQAVLYYILNYPVPPSLIVDVSRVWEQRVQAVTAYRSQFHNPKSNEQPTFISRKISWR